MTHFHNFAVTIGADSEEISENLLLGVRFYIHVLVSAVQPFSKDISKQLSMMTSVLHDINGNIKNDNDTGEIVVFIWESWRWVLSDQLWSC